MEQVVREILTEARKLEILTRRDSTESLTGAYHSTFKGSGMEFEEVRGYIPGDDIRAIDWNVTARQGAPFIKRYREERQLRVMLVVDISASQAFGSAQQTKRRLTAQIAAVIGHSALRNNDQVGLLLFAGDTVGYTPPQSGPHVLARLVHDILLKEAPIPGTRLSRALDELNAIERRRCITFLLSDFLFDEQENIHAFSRLAQTARRHDVIAIRTTDPLEAELPPVGWVRFRDAETGRIHAINTSDPNTRTFHREQSRKIEDRLSSELARCGVDMVTIGEKPDWIWPLRAFFKARERRR